MFLDETAILAQLCSIRDLVHLFSIHTLKIRLEMPIAYLFYSYNKFWQSVWQPSSSFSSFWSQIVWLFLILFLIRFAFSTPYFWKLNSYSLLAGGNPGASDQLSPCLPAICHSSSTGATNRVCLPHRYFSLNQSSGVLSIRQNTPAGSYWLRVGVSDGVWPDVMSGVRVHVRELEEKAILSSASLRLTGKITDGINMLIILSHGNLWARRCCDA